MLNRDNGRRPELVTSDTAGYSDMVFGLYRICGMQYAPRLADLSDTRFWRLDPAADYGPSTGWLAPGSARRRSPGTGSRCCGSPDPWPPGRSARTT